MKKLNNYITEAWSGVKQQSIKAEIENWCEEMGIQNYTINSKDEIDVDGDVDLSKNDFKELPYKFGRVDGLFTLSMCKNLTSLKNCPYSAFGFICSYCKKLDSLKGCPQKVGGNFWYFDCRKCKREFTKEEVVLLCNISKKDIFV